MGRDKQQAKKGKGGDGEKKATVIKSKEERSKNYHRKRKAPHRRPDLGLMADMDRSAENTRKAVVKEASQRRLFREGEHKDSVSTADRSDVR